MPLSWRIIICSLLQCLSDCYVMVDRASRSGLVGGSVRENDGGSNDAKNDISVWKLAPSYFLMVIKC